MQHGLAAQSLRLGAFRERVEARLRAFDAERTGPRIWQKDGTVWIPDAERAAKTPDLANRLDWLGLPEEMQKEIEGLNAFAEQIRKDDFRHVVLLGMGGSSLAAEVFMSLFGNRPGHPPLIVCDSTDPEAVRRIAASVNPAKTFFLVSSKSGGTLETLSFFRYFFDRAGAVKADPGSNFVAITDPGSDLEAIAAEKGFRRVFSSPPGVGGRYSAFTFFGLVPAALIGVDLSVLLGSARAMARACGPDVPAADNPGLALGAALGELALFGRDKVTFVPSLVAARFGVWVEQLLAESTGKEGRGILPVAGEPPGDPGEYGPDRVFVHLRLKDGATAEEDRFAAALEAAGHPLVRIDLESLGDLGGEFFRWEFATAAAGAVLGINPFDQPDVEAAKRKARKLMAAFERTGRLPEDGPCLEERGISLFEETAVGGDLPSRLEAFLAKVRPGDYIALLVYASPTEETDRSIEALRLALRRRFKTAVTAGYGPRYLHSTGQLHKGDGNRGIFVQFTREPEEDLAVPEAPYSFGVLLAAQAQGDFQALLERGRRVIRLHVKGRIDKGIEAVRKIIEP